MRSIRFEQLSRPFAVLFPFLALAGVAVPLFLGLETFAVLAIYIAIPLLLAAFYYVLVRRPGEVDGIIGETSLPFKALLTGYVVCQAAALVLLVSAAVRPRAYFVVIALAATFVLVQILRSRLTPTRTGVVLLECAGIVLNVIGGVTFKYEYFFGRTDVFPHEAFTRVVLEEQYVTSAFASYESFPLFHIFAATLRLYSGWDVPPRYFFFLTSMAAYVALIGGIYLLSKRLFESRRIALTAALLTSVNTWVLFNGLYSIPRSIVAVLCVFALLAMIDSSRLSYVVLVVLTFGIVLYHTVSVPFFVVCLGTVYLVQNLFGSGWVNRPFHIRDLVTVAAIQVGYYVFGAPEMLERIRTLLFSPSISGATGAGGTSAEIPNVAAELANYLQFSLLLCFIAVALVIGLRSERIPWAGKAVILSAALLSVVSFPGPLLLVGKLAANFNIIRFGQYTFPFIVMAGAAGIVVLADADLSVRTPTATTAFRALTIVLVCSMAFLAVSNDFVASDNPTVEREFYTYYLTESETEGIDSLSRLTDETMFIDAVGCKYAAYSEADGNCTIMRVDPDTGEFPTSGPGDVVVVRTTELERRGLQVLLTDEYTEASYAGNEQYIDAEAAAWDSLSRENKVFVTEDVAAYTTPTQSNATASSARYASGLQ